MVGGLRLGIWDDLMKMLVRAHPQDFVSLLHQNTRYLEDITSELKMRSIRADFLCKAERDGQEVIVHGEFQKRKDLNMGQRVWEYNCVTSFLTQLPVCSFVLYLVKSGSIAEPPFRIVLKNGEVIHTFHYTNIFLWEIPPEALMRKGMEGMLPLLPLTKGADLARDNVVDGMITGMREAGKEDVLSLGYAFASLVYATEGDKQWLKRRFAMFEDTLENSWFYKEVLQKGLEQGVKQGMEQGVKQGLEQGVKQGIDIGERRGIEEAVRALQPVLMRVLETRFPELLPLAQEEAERSTAPAALSSKINKLLVAQTMEEARQILLEH